MKLKSSHIKGLGFFVCLWELHGTLPLFHLVPNHYLANNESILLAASSCCSL
ncbi:MAG: hypothetical protein ACI35P_05140 [Bacillus sp. (in: firmicutes)]